jgi:hypothetical protein
MSLDDRVAQAPILGHPARARGLNRLVDLTQRSSLGFKVQAMLRFMIVMVILVTVVAQARAGEMLIDDFSTERSALGTEWQGFTDRVMGGRSDMQAGYRDVDGQMVLSIRGQVRLDNNGGFIQARLPLDARGGFLDASSFAGVRIQARALKPGAYYLHLRTTDTRRPWAYYRARLDLTDSWATLAVPWTAFEPRSLDRSLKPSRLRSLAVVAYGEAFEADIEVARIEWLTD